MNDLSAVTSFICVLQTASTRLLLKLRPSSGTAPGGRLCPLLGTAQCTGWWFEVLSCCFLPPFPLLPLFQCIFCLLPCSSATRSSSFHPLLGLAWWHRDGRACACPDSSWMPRCESWGCSFLKDVAAPVALQKTSCTRSNLHRDADGAVPPHLHAWAPSVLVVWLLGEQAVQRTLVSALCLLVQRVTATLTTSLLPKSIFQPVFISHFALGGQPWCFWGSVALGSAAGSLQGRAGWDWRLSPRGGCFWIPKGYPSVWDCRKVLESQISKWLHNWTKVKLDIILSHNASNWLESGCYYTDWKTDWHNIKSEFIRSGGGAREMLQGLLLN